MFFHSVVLASDFIRVVTLWLGQYNGKSHKPLQMTRKSSTLDDLEEPLRTLLRQSCGIVVKRYVVRRRRWYRWIRRWRLSYAVSIMSIPAAVWPQFWMQVAACKPNYPSVDYGVWYSNVVTVESCFLNVTRSRTLAFGYRRYGSTIRSAQPTLASAGLLVQHFFITAVWKQRCAH